MGSFQFVLPTVRYAPPVQSMCYYMVNQYLKIRPMRLGVANNMHPLCLGGTNGKDPKYVSKVKKTKTVHQKSFISKRKKLITCKSDFPVFYAKIEFIRFPQITKELTSKMLINVLARECNYSMWV